MKALLKQFDYKDHLGNTRVSFKANGNRLEKLAETAYDPTGIELLGIGQENTPENRFKFQGKESLTLFGLNNIIDFDARYLDKTINRFLGIDAMASSFPSFSPYVNTLNNPLAVIDPSGNFAMSYNDAFSDDYCPTCPLDITAKLTPITVEADPLRSIAFCSNRYDKITYFFLNYHLSIQFLWQYG